MEIIDRSKATAISPVEHYSGRLLVLIVASSSPDAALDHSCGYIYKWFLGWCQRKDEPEPRHHPGWDLIVVCNWAREYSGQLGGASNAVWNECLYSRIYRLIIVKFNVKRQNVKCREACGYYFLIHGCATVSVWQCHAREVSPRILDVLLWYYVMLQPAKTRCNWLGLYIFFLSFSKPDYL